MGNIVPGSTADHIGTGRLNHVEACPYQVEAMQPRGLRNSRPPPQAPPRAPTREICMRALAGLPCAGDLALGPSKAERDAGAISGCGWQRATPDRSEGMGGGWKPAGRALRAASKSSSFPGGSCSRGARKDAAQLAGEHGTPQTATGTASPDPERPQIPSEPVH